LAVALHEYTPWAKGRLKIILEIEAEILDIVASKQKN
jgi:hypothetical protein